MPHLCLYEKAREVHHHALRRELQERHLLARLPKQWSISTRTASQLPWSTMEGEPKETRSPQSSEVHCTALTSCSACASRRQPIAGAALHPPASEYVCKGSVPFDL